MMNKHMGRTLIVACCLAGGLLGGLGCHRSDSAVTFVSYKDPYFPEPFHVDFIGCSYREEPTGDLHVLGQTETMDDGEELTQYLHVHIYWQPRPGRTYVNETTTNALLEYVIQTDEGTATYSGTGFAYPKTRRDGTLEVEIESAYMKLDRITGTLPDLFGDTKLTGTLLATRDEAGSLKRQRTMELVQRR
jgi:hypothetical protein